MIKNINLVAENSGAKLNTLSILSFTRKKNEFLTEAAIEFTQTVVLDKLLLEIEFEAVPRFWRGSDYTWKKISIPYLTANYHSPKILKFEDQSFAAATTAQGCWEWDSNSQKLLWYLIHPDLNPTFRYNAEDKREWVTKQKIRQGHSFKLGIYVGMGPVPEIARSPIGFVPTVCFTDHCDFDTPVLLAAQRELFAANSIKTTKGFFLHTYSHQGDFAAMDQAGMKDEFARWEHDGHELAYHALSRSFREESWLEFQNFESPTGFDKVSTYIDHGYLEYNYTKQASEKKADWYSHMEGKGIKLIWNYLDVIEGNSLSNNQLSPYDSSVKSIKDGAGFQKANKLPVDKSRDTKTWLVYGTSENLDKGIKRFSTHFRKRTEYGLTKVLASGLALIPMLFDQEIWRKNLLERNKPFHFARFAPVFFKGMNQSETSISVFQTISVKDYVSIFSMPSLEKLSRECGLLIAHTYFGFLGDNHPGRIFLNERGALNPAAEKSFELLGEYIKEGKLWNPTVKQLHAFHQKLENLTFEVISGQLKPVNAPSEVRYID